MLFAFIIVFCVIFVDQMVKFWIISSIPLLESQSFIPGIVDLLHVHNTGASWGILAGQRYVFIGLTIIVAAYLIRLIVQSRLKGIERLGYSLILGGAIGNLIDRIRLGYVVDMFRLKFMNFPIFNVADIALTLGVIVLIVGILLEKETKEK